MNSSQTTITRKWFGRGGTVSMARVLGLGVWLLLACLSMFSQGNTGRILGNVSDQSGGAMVGATVTVKDVQRGVVRTLITDDAGTYVAPDLLPGTYDVRAEAKGFSASDHPGILLEVGRDFRVDVVLQPGEQAQTITVTESLPMVETTNATLGGTVSNEVINDLPMNGRDYKNLLVLIPGVTAYPGGGGFVNSTNGMRGEANVYLVDGVLDDEPGSGLSVISSGATVAGDASSLLPIDAIQEFHTEENPKAEYGWRIGGVINVGLKSGTNSLHGTAYAFGRDDVFDARNYFNTPPNPKTPVALEQFGATVGGPIMKDKLFYFLGFEDQRYNVGSTFEVNAPVTGPLTAAQDPNNQLSLVNACTALNAKGTPINALSAQLAGLNAATCTVSPSSSTVENLFPLNSGTSPLGPTAFFPGLLSNNLSDNGIAKVDYHINDHNALNGLFFVSNLKATWNDVPNELSQQWEANIPNRTYVGSGNWTWTPNSNWVNELRGGYTSFARLSFSSDQSVNPASPWPAGYGINTGVTNPLYFGMPALSISSFSNFQLGAATKTGVGDFPGYGGNGNEEVVDHISYLHGKHAFAFGGELIRNFLVSGSFTNERGSITFSSLQNYLAGVPSSGAILVGNPVRTVHNGNYAAFIQDDWRVTPKLIVNLGVRYERATPWAEAHGQLGGFDPVRGLVQVGDGLTSPYNGHNNFSPRLGLAWDVTGKGKTVVRAGGSIIYDQSAFSPFTGITTVPTGAKITTLNSAGQAVTVPGNGNMAVASFTFSGASLNWSTAGPVFPIGSGAVRCGDGLTPTGGPKDPNPCNAFTVDPNLRVPYATNWNLSIQQAFTNSLAVDVAYVGNHVTGLLGLIDLNQPPLDSGYSPSCVLATVAACEQAARPFNSQFPYLKFIEELTNPDISNYNGLQVTLTQRASHGLSFIAGYTYSHTLDDQSLRTAALPTDSTRPYLQYASSDFDIRHRLTFSTTYAIPGKQGFAQMLEGWQLNSVVTIQTGGPWGFQDFSNDFSGTGEVKVPTGSGERWDFSGNPSDFTSSQNDIPFCTGPGNGGCLGQAGQPLSAATSSAMWTLCQAHAASMATLSTAGCFVEGSSIMTPPALGTYGTAGRNIFRDSGFKDWDVSVAKNFKYRERLTAQFRAEFFNVLNHPNFANPYGGPNFLGNNDPSAGIGAGCGCVTPDQAGSNPVLGSGGARDIQLGLKLTF